MPAFDVRVTDASGRVPVLAELDPPMTLRLQEWQDVRVPAVAGLERRHLAAELGTGVHALCTPDGGDEAPPDEDLDGSEFRWVFLEWPGPVPPELVRMGGRTSHVAFTTAIVGHYTLAVALFNSDESTSGQVIVHVDVLPEVEA